MPDLFSREIFAILFFSVFKCVFNLSAIIRIIFQAYIIERAQQVALERIAQTDTVWLQQSLF